MKKNIIIVLLIIISLLSLIFGYYQKVRADRQETRAIENVKMAREAEIRAEQIQKEAETQRLMSEKIAKKAMELAEMSIKLQMKQRIKINKTVLSATAFYAQLYFYS